MTKAGSPIIEGLKQAVRAARCRHACCVQDTWPDGSPKTEFCIRCETTFHIPQGQK
jgi:hypothetical protein